MKFEDYLKIKHELPDHLQIAIEAAYSKGETVIDLSEPWVGEIIQQEIDREIIRDMWKVKKEQQIKEWHDKQYNEEVLRAEERGKLEVTHCPICGSDITAGDSIRSFDSRIPQMLFFKCTKCDEEFGIAHSCHKVLRYLNDIMIGTKVEVDAFNSKTGDPSA